MLPLLFITLLTFLSNPCHCQDIDFFDQIINIYIDLTDCQGVDKQEFAAEALYLLRSGLGPKWGFKPDFRPDENWGLDFLEVIGDLHDLTNRTNCARIELIRCLIKYSVERGWCGDRTAEQVEQRMDAIISNHTAIIAIIEDNLAQDLPFIDADEMSHRTQLGNNTLTDFCSVMEAEMRQNGTLLFDNCQGILPVDSGSGASQIWIVLAVVGLLAILSVFGWCVYENSRIRRIGVSRKNRLE